MAADTPVMERTTNEKVFARSYSGFGQADYVSEQAHNARIKDTYARLIDPNNSLEDVFAREEKAMARPVENTVAEAPRAEAPYLVHNARADADIFRASNAYNRVDNMAAQAEVAAYPVEEDEDLRPTSTTIQYQTLDEAKKDTRVYNVSESKRTILGKKEKTIIAVFVAVVIALLTLVVINSAVIASLEDQIAAVQTNIDTVRGAIAGVNSSISEIITESVSGLLSK